MPRGNVVAPVYHELDFLSRLYGHSSVNLNRKLKDTVKAAGLPDIHLHSLRHTHASLLINSDVTARVIADRLGHSTTKTTLDTYSHVFAASEVKAMQAVEMALFKQDE